MKKFLIIGIIVLLGAYFVMSLVVFPDLYLSQDQLKPKPYFDVKISDEQITLGESFGVKIFSENIGDYGDIFILSVGFPTLSEIDDQIKITNYDFNHTPQKIKKGTILGAKYSGGVDKVSSQYASIEIMNRPTHAKEHYTMDLSVMPKNPGKFEFYVKTIAIPHTSDLAHFPQDGFVDPQGEYVKVYSVMVNP